MALNDEDSSYPSDGEPNESAPPPSTMLYQLLGWCTEQGESIVRTTFENLSEDGSPNMPVGTTLALIEQGMKVLSAIHFRLHYAGNQTDDSAYREIIDGSKR